MTDHPMHQLGERDPASHATQSGRELNRLANSATAHCLTGCAIGEILGLVIGTALGWSTPRPSSLRSPWRSSSATPSPSSRFCGRDSPSAPRSASP